MEESFILLPDGRSEFTGRYGFIRQDFMFSGTMSIYELLYTVFASMGTVGFI